MKQRSIADSFNSAIEGFLYVIKTQKNMRFHFLSAVVIFLAAIYFNIPVVQILLLCAAISLVLILEMVNTAMEHTIDIVAETFHPLARIIKDIMAGSVLISAVNALIVGYLIFQQRSGLDIGIGLSRVRQSPWHLTFIATILVLAFVVVFKLAFQRGTPLRGGMPSGHAAFVFSVWVIIVFLSQNSLVIILSLIVSLLVCRSRIKQRIHNIWEVIAGALLGALITTSVFQLMK